MFRVGLLEIETSHRERFTEALHAGQDARVTVVSPGRICPEAEAADFVKRYAIPAMVSAPGEMVDKVDIAFILGTDWDRHLELARPFLRAGKPVFIDKPLAGKLKDCLEMERLVRDEGARIIGSSSLRYATEILDARRELAAKGETIHYAAAVCKGEFDYAIHAMEMLGGIFGGGAESVQHLGGDAPGIYLVRYAGNRQGIFMINGPRAFCAEVATAKSYRQIAVDPDRIYRTLMTAVIAFLKGEPHGLAPIGDLTESIRIALAARQSQLQDGKSVRLADLDVNDAGFDGAAFSAAYGVAKRRPKSGVAIQQSTFGEKRP